MYKKNTRFIITICINSVIQLLQTTVYEFEPKNDT